MCVCVCVGMRWDLERLYSVFLSFGKVLPAYYFKVVYDYVFGVVKFWD